MRHYRRSVQSKKLHKSHYTQRSRRPSHISIDIDKSLSRTFKTHKLETGVYSFSSDLVVKKPVRTRCRWEAISTDAVLDASQHPASSVAASGRRSRWIVYDRWRRCGGNSQVISPTNRNALVTTDRREIVKRGAATGGFSEWWRISSSVLTRRR